MRINGEGRASSVARFWKLVGRRYTEQRPNPSRGSTSRPSGFGKHLRGQGWRGVRDFKASTGGLESVEAAIVAGLVVAGLLGLLVALGAWAWRALSRLEHGL